MNKTHVFLSYCRDNKSEVARLRDDLMAAGETVWWDQDILPGQDWKREIRAAMNSSYAVIVCLSKETEGRTTSGIYPELMDAIEIFREYTPGQIFLIAVRLSPCEIPLIEIDSTRTLDRLNYVDLFPASERTFNLNRLIEAVLRSPFHP